jgi:hypothetical protein
MGRFRIKEQDTIKATAVSEDTRKFLSSIYDSGFTTIQEVEDSLTRKIPHFTGKKINITITNCDKEECKNYTISVNK